MAQLWGLQAGSQWPLSLEFFERLRATQMVDEIALGAAISACEEGGRLDRNAEENGWMLKLLMKFETWYQVNQ